MKKILMGLLACIALGFATANAQTTTEPIFHAFKFDDQGIITKMSDNGQWAVSFGANSSNTLFGVNPRLLNLKDFSDKNLTEGIDPAMVISASAFDVTDDGSIVVGEYNLMPGYWNTTTGEWVKLPMRLGATGGCVNAVTPDGKYAVGNFTYEDNPEADFPFKETEALWDLKNNKLISLKGLPQKDMANENKKQNRFIDISADGKTLIGCLSISYWPSGNYAGGKCFYVYHIQEKTFEYVGFVPNNSGRWTPMAENMTFIESAVVSNNGQWITGTAQSVKDNASQEFDPEYSNPYIYNTVTKEFRLLNSSSDNGVTGTSITNDGIVLGANPDNNPYREWSIRSGNYWYPIQQVLKQKYGYDLKAKNGLENTGTPIAISNDNRTLSIMIDPYSCYAIRLPESVNTICNNINLLGNYDVEPMAGSELTKLQNVSVTFDREIEVIGAKNAVQILNAKGEAIYSSVGFKADDNAKTISIVFRKGTLEAGQQYTLRIPAGSISLKGDHSKTNNKIDIQYVGRADAPVAMVSVVPENLASIAKIDASSSPIILTFDANVKVKSEMTAHLYRAEEDAPFCELLMGSNGKSVALYPANTQMLYKGANYRIVIPAGAVTDVTGNNGNKEITLNYIGAFEREVSTDDKILFSDNFDNGITNFLLFDGDKNNPNDFIKGWGFADNTNFPWSIVRDTETSNDMAAASHSMYDPQGKSYDWLVIPQTFIPDNLCTLKFQSQSYLNNADDYLKVIVWASDNVYNVLNKTIVDKMYKEGSVVYNKKQTPGKNEDLMEGDWTNNTIDLRQFAGKNVYIAFVNENKAQSAIFLNNVEVLHNIPFLVTFDHQTKVTAQKDIIVEGRITNDSDTEVYTSAQLTLKDASGKVIETLTNKNLNLKKGDTYKFTFNKALPLLLGKVNNFSLDVKMNNTQNTIKSSVKNLSFEPVKRVVLEEFTGMNCPNCPLGILAINKIKSIYGKQFLPIAVHGYPGDQLGVGFNAYSEYLGFSAAPSGMIQRSKVISSPMVSVDQDYRFNGVNGEKLWLDLVQDELAVPADAEISASAKTDMANKTIEVPCTIRYAMDTEDLNVNLFMAIVEDDVIGYQQNNLSGMSDTDLGAFGAGGKYGQAMNYPFYHQHVARGWYGNTFAGTGGLIPTSVIAGKDYTTTIKATLPEAVKDINKTKVVVMMIDANTERVINAIEVPANGSATGIEDAVANENILIEALQQQVVVNSNSAAQICVYNTAGRMIGSAAGQGIMQISARGYHGVAIVKVTTAQQTIIKKVML